jgi:solute carrier family 25 phosphate transporter 23/24/25/41
MERISTLLMTPVAHQRLSVTQAVGHAWRDGGLPGLYRGHAATLVKIFPASAIQFAVFNSVKDRVLAARQPRRQPQGAQQAQQPSQDLANHERLVAGAAAGAAAACCCYPLESMRTAMSMAGGVRGNLLQAAGTVVAAHGVGGLYRGFRAALVGDVLGNALGFTAYEMGNRVYRDLSGGKHAPPHIRGLIGACSASCVLTLTMPLEVVRRRLQVQVRSREARTRRGGRQAGRQAERVGDRVGRGGQAGPRVC